MSEIAGRVYIQLDIWANNRWRCRHCLNVELLGIIPNVRRYVFPVRRLRAYPIQLFKSGPFYHFGSESIRIPIAQGRNVVE